MFVYSKKIKRFIEEIEITVRNILDKEGGVLVREDHFFDLRCTSSYPICIKVYNHKRILGYFDPVFYELGFHECLMDVSRGQLHDIIRHELAHYITFINHGYCVEPHATEFRMFCSRMGWGENVYKAAVCLKYEGAGGERESSSIFRKVQKLMALSTSSNKNEAEQAMIKSQQLLLKHNIDAESISDKEDEKIYLKRLMKQKKENAKMRAIARILSTFFVNVVYRRGTECIYLEVLGSSVNVEIAEYVADILQIEMDKLWDQAKKEASLKGLMAKNSFFLGLAKGYCHKINSLKKKYTHETTNALMVVEKKLNDEKAMVYKKLSYARSSGGYCRDSAALGERMGGQLTINPGINQSAKDSQAFLINY